MRELLISFLLILTGLSCYSQTDSNNQTKMEKYLLHGKLTAKSGHADELSEILVQASKAVSTAKGCKLYVISRDNSDVNAIWVTEIWDSKADHDASLTADGVKELIMKAMPIIDREAPKDNGQELKLIGGVGIL
jgi:quinol monooxygenase YgiN